MDSTQWILVALAVVAFLTISSYAVHMIHRRQARQEKCFEALQRTCSVCGAVRDSPCIDKHGAPVFLHWPRVAGSLQSKPPRFEDLNHGKKFV